MSLQSERLTAEEFFTMCHAANIGVVGQRLIRKHLLAHGHMVCPTDQSVRELGKDAVLPAETSSIKIDNETMSDSYKEVHQLKKQKLGTALQLWTSF